MTSHIYGITGLKGHGKDTFARMVRDYEPSKEWYITHFAETLKHMCKELFGLTDYQLHNTEGKNSPITPVVLDDLLSEMSAITGLSILPHGKVATSPRELFQYFGTEYVRGVRDTYWIDDIRSKIVGKPLVLIPDLRFIVEEEFLRSVGGRVIRITRLDLPDACDKHGSEHEYLRIVPDLLLGTLTGKTYVQNLASSLISSGAFSQAIEACDYRKWSAGDRTQTEEVLNSLLSYYELTN